MGLFPTLLMSEHWSRLEVEAAVSDYLEMLGAELRGEAVNKAEHNRALQKTLQRRTKGSIERKHQNISTVLIELGYPYINGYKPLRNYQDLLAEVVRDRLHDVAQTGFDALVQKIVNEPIEPPSSWDVGRMEVAAPQRDNTYNTVREERRWQPAAGRRNFLEIETRNNALGLAGEELALEFEYDRLRRAGHKNLAEKVEHVSRSHGDHLGYDILSFEESGRERLIEVKTTRFGVATPFFLTANEVTVSREQAEYYQLYRLFDFSKSPKMFRLEGALEHHCTLRPTEYRAVPW